MFQGVRIDRPGRLARLRQLLRERPVVAMHGPRRAGKTTLAKHLAARNRTGASFFDLEDPREAAPGAVHQGEPHAKGNLEHIVLLAGRLRVGPVASTVTLEPGDLATFAADVPHLYEALVPGTRALMIMDYA